VVWLATRDARGLQGLDLFAGGGPFRGHLADGINGMTMPWIALAFQLRAFDKRVCVQRLGEVNPATFAAVTVLIRNLTSGQADFRRRRKGDSGDCRAEQCRCCRPAIWCDDDGCAGAH